MSGPSSVNEGGTGTYTATGTWDNGTTAAITPTWSENSSYATISTGGVLTASAVTANQAVTVTATYGGRTGTMSVTIVDVPAVLTAVTVSGPSSVNEGATGTYTATGTWDNGTTAAITPTWSENSSYATISAGGVLTASAVTSNQAVTVTATYGGRTGTMSVTIVDVPAMLSGIAVSGPSSVNEGATGTYTATGTWDNGTTAAITPTWSENSSYATISAGGVLTASAVTANQAVTVTATLRRPDRHDERDDRQRGGDAEQHRGERSVVGERRRDRDVHGDGDVGQRDDGGDQPDVERELVVRVDQRGRRADGVDGDGEPGGDGDGSYGGTDRHDERDDRRRAGSGACRAQEYGYYGSLSVRSSPSVAAPSVAAPPVAGRSSAQLGSRDDEWDGTPIDPGRTVRYTAYWTDDPALSAGSLRPLASLISGTTLDFDPSAYQMVKNQVVYLTVRAILDTGDQSSLAASLDLACGKRGSGSSREREDHQEVVSGSTPQSPHSGLQLARGLPYALILSWSVCRFE